MSVGARSGDGAGPFARRDGPVLVTGGAGFVGANLADHFAAAGREVIVFDNLSRAGVAENLAWLQARHGRRIRAVIADLRDRAALGAAVADAAAVFHFAAQVAVTTSLVDPIEDFEVNARGTLNLLEALRACAAPPPLLFSSTNKVYGHLDEVALAEQKTRYAPVDPARRAGIDESQPLALYSPYGCSKGAADQYVLDYARIYGLPAVVFRMSCIYGPRQFGTEDQGWVAHFLLSALAGAPITIYGDGKQVRDILFVADLVEAFVRALAEIETLRGRAFNIGGGPENAVSLREMLALIRRRTGQTVRLCYAAARPGDQLYYVSDIRAFAAATGWRPAVGPEEGLARLCEWLRPRVGAADLAASRTGTLP